MEFLRTLTVIYAAVLVLALAASLIVILVYLRRIAGALGGVESELREVGTATEPLERLIGPLKEQTARTREAFDRAAGDLESACSAVEAVAERRGAGAPAG